MINYINNFFDIFCFIYLGFGVWQCGSGVGGRIIDGGVVDGGAGVGLAGREEQIRGALVVARGFGDWEGVRVTGGLRFWSWQCGRFVEERGFRAAFLRWLWEAAAAAPVRR